jgi:hypothetical protein
MVVNDLENCCCACSWRGSDNNAVFDDGLLVTVIPVPVAAALTKDDDIRAVPFDGIDGAVRKRIVGGNMSLSYGIVNRHCYYELRVEGVNRRVATDYLMGM